MSTIIDNGSLRIFRETDWPRGLAPERLQQVTANWMAWFKRLKKDGRCTAGNPHGQIVEAPEPLAHAGTTSQPLTSHQESNYAHLR